MFPKLRIKESAAKMGSLRSPYPCLRIAGQSDSHDLHLLVLGNGACELRTFVKQHENDRKAILLSNECGAALTDFSVNGKRKNICTVTQKP